MSIGNSAFSNCTELADVYCYAETVPNTGINVFYGSYTEYSTLHVPASAIASYRTMASWSRFGSIVALDGSSLPQCSAPAILYENGIVKFRSATEGATCHYTITDSDVRTGTEANVTLSLTYHITAYATKEGYADSEVSEATLCWLGYEPRQDGITTDMNDVKDETLADIQAKPVTITNSGSTLTVSGAEDGTQVSVYDLSGQLCGTATTRGGHAIITTTIPSGSVVIVQLGSKSVKVRMK